MKKDEIFFAEQGLTTTSANYIANLAKESYQSLERELQLVKLYSREVSLLGSSETKKLREGVDDLFLKGIPIKLHTIALYKSLIAWLREAIKAKERLISEAESLSAEVICKYLNITLPERPDAYVRLTEDDVIATWNIKQRNRYYQLDTLCSVIGSYIHRNGVFANQREELQKILSENNEVSGSGRDMVIFTNTPSCSPETVENIFFSLQKTYREYQAELNSLKHSIETTLQEDDRKKTAKEKEEYSQFATKYNEVQNVVNAYRKEIVAKAQGLKIRIPDSLKEIYDTVNKAGKD